jgi:hypothetical protein
VCRRAHLRWLCGRLLRRTWSTRARDAACLSHTQVRLKPPGVSHAVVFVACIQLPTLKRVVLLSTGLPASPRAHVHPSSFSDDDSDEECVQPTWMQHASPEAVQSSHYRTEDAATLAWDPVASLPQLAWQFAGSLIVERRHGGEEAAAALKAPEATGGGNDTSRDCDEVSSRAASPCPGSPGTDVIEDSDPEGESPRTAWTARQLSPSPPPAAHTQEGA